MAIVMKYGAPGPILQAAYAAGVGHRMNEQKDDALKVWSQQNQQQFQAEQSWLNRAQQSNLQQNAIAQQWAMQKDAFAQQKTMAEAGRTFQAEQQQNEFGFRSTQAGRARQYNAEQQSANDTRDFYTKAFFSLPQIPDFAGGDQRKSLTNTRSAIQGLLTQGFDTSRPEVREKLDEQISAYNSGISSLMESYSPAADANRNTFYRDKSGFAYDKPGEGLTAFDRRTGKPVIEDTAAATAAQTEKERRTYIANDLERRLGILDEKTGKPPDEDVARKEAISAWDKLQMDMQGGRSAATRDVATGDGSGAVYGDQRYTPSGQTYSTTPGGGVYRDPNAGNISREPARPGASNEKAELLGSPQISTAGPGSSQPAAEPPPPPELPPGATYAGEVPGAGSAFSLPNVGMVTKVDGEWKILERDTSGRWVEVGELRLAQPPTAPQQAPVSPPPTVAAQATPQAAAAPAQVAAGSGYAGQAVRQPYSPDTNQTVQRPQVLPQAAPPPQSSPPAATAEPVASADDLDRQWAALPPGGRMRLQDGKIYRKRRGQ